MIFRSIVSRSGHRCQACLMLSVFYLGLVLEWLRGRLFACRICHNVLDLVLISPVWGYRLAFHMVLRVIFVDLALVLGYVLFLLVWYRPLRRYHCFKTLLSTVQLLCDTKVCQYSGLKVLYSIVTLVINFRRIKGQSLTASETLYVCVYQKQATWHYINSVFGDRWLHLLTVADYSFIFRLVRGVSPHSILSLLPLLTVLEEYGYREVRYSKDFGNQQYENRECLDIDTGGIWRFCNWQGLGCYSTVLDKWAQSSVIEKLGILYGWLSMSTAFE